MDTVVGLVLVLLLMLGITRTPREYIIFWSFATPIFYIIFGAKTIFISLGFTDVELFSGVLPILVTVMAFMKLTPNEKRRAWKYSPKLWFLFLGYYGLSLFWSDNAGTGVRTVIQVAFPSFLYLIAFNIIQGDGHIAKYFKILMIINVIVATFDAYNAVAGWSYMNGSGYMNEGVIGYRTVSAYFYATMGVLFFVRMMDKFSVLHLLVFILDVALLLMMASRTPTYTFILGITIAIIYRRNIAFTLIGIFALAVFVGLLFILPSKSRFINEDNSLNRSDSGRNFFQQFFETRAEEAPPWGWGAGSSEKYAYWISSHITNVGAPHNEYLRIKFDGGQLGLVLFYIGLADLLVRGLFLGRWLKKYFPFKAILIMTPVMFALSCTNDNTFFYFYVFTQYLFTFMGFGARIAYEERVRLGEEVIVLDPVEIELIGANSHGIAVT